MVVSVVSSGFEDAEREDEKLTLPRVDSKPWMTWLTSMLIVTVKISILLVKLLIETSGH